MTLALLLTAVGGAWAQTETLLTTITATGTDSYSETTPGVVTVTHDNDKFDVDWGWIWRYQPGSITVEAKEGYTITKCVFSQPEKTPVTVSTAPFKVNFLYNDNEDYEKYLCVGTDPDEGIDGFTSIEVYGYKSASSGPDAIDVTTNAAEEGATFTEASFEMPTSDVDVDYELVRDLGYKVAFSGVPTRARLAKDGEGKFHFADGLTFQLLDNIDANNPKDITSAEGITFMVGEVDAVDIEGSTFYQLDKETLVPLADFLADAHLGNYAICAVASTGEYDGSFTSDRITLFQGYEVQVAAKEFITYYKDEPLYVEDTDVTLYTITAVSGDKATATEVTTAPAGLPLLVKNNSADREKTTVLLIPTTDRTPDTGIEVYAGFLGTLEATTILASDASTDRYALNGHEFVWVKNPVSIAANKAWLEVPTGAAAGARALTIVFSDETTGVNEVIEVNGVTDDTFYDLNGRKVAVPNKKGIYIQNGKKVVIK